MSDLLKALEYKVDTSRLVYLLLSEEWQRECEIIADYVAPHAPKGTEPRCVVKRGEGKDAIFLRYSKGPGQGHFWDCYGDDYHNRELAILALHNAPAPPRGKLYFEVSIPLADGIQKAHS